MDFIDWRKSPEKITIISEQDREREARRRIKETAHYVDEQIRLATERGEFDNLPGMGRPLQFDESPYAGDRALAYSLLKSNGYLPAEIELGQEIERDLERTEAQMAGIIRRGQDLLRRRILFAGEKRTYNAVVKKKAVAYEEALRETNRRILTYNLMVPSSMHKALVKIEERVQQFREACPLFRV